MIQWYFILLSDSSLNKSYFCSIDPSSIIAVK